MKKRAWISLLLVVLAFAVALWLFRTYVAEPSEAGFMLVSLKDNSLLVSDEDVLYYNWTSQEIALEDGASERLRQMEDDLYSFKEGFVIKINGKELYQGVFRSPVMSAIPAPPRISIMFPSMLYTSETENYHAMRMFYPECQPPTDQPEKNSKLAQYFEGIGKLTY